MSDEHAEPTTDPRGQELWRELEENVVDPREQPPGLTFEGPGEPGEGTDPADTASGEVVPGVLGGPPVVITREDEN